MLQASVAIRGLVLRFIGRPRAPLLAPEMPTNCLSLCLLVLVVSGITVTLAP